MLMGRDVGALMVLIFTDAIGDFISFSFLGPLFWWLYAGNCLGCFGSETGL
jgi:hypothetical protein